MKNKEPLDLNKARTEVEMRFLKTLLEQNKECENEDFYQYCEAMVDLHFGFTYLDTEEYKKVKQKPVWELD